MQAVGTRPACYTWGLLSTALGHLMFCTMVGRAVSRLSIKLYLIPMVSVMGALLLGSLVTTAVVLGGGLRAARRLAFDLEILHAGAASSVLPLAHYSLFYIESKSGSHIMP